MYAELIVSLEAQETENRSSAAGQRAAWCWGRGAHQPGTHRAGE